MKRFPGEQFVAWFGYTRRERRASLVLLILIVIIGGARYAVPQSDIEIRIIPGDSLIYEEGLAFSPVVDTPAIRNRSEIRRLPSSRVLELNTCDSAALESLPAIGPVLAARIIKYRNLLGGYARPDQLLEVYGLSPEAYSRISSRISADTTLIRKIDINSADFRELIRLPYFERYEVNAILKYRELKGRFNNVDELFENKLVAEEKKRLIKAYTVSE